MSELGTSENAPSASITLRPVSSRIPRSFQQKQDAGLPLSILAQPCGEFAAGDAPLLSLPAGVSSQQVARCGVCFGYINNACFWSGASEGHKHDFERGSDRLPEWQCSLCGHQNTLRSGFEAQRYAALNSRDTRAAILQTCPELSSSVYEFASADEEPPSLAENRHSPRQAYVAVVSLLAMQQSSSFAEGLVQGLNAAVESLPAHFLLALVAY